MDTKKRNIIIGAAAAGLAVILLVVIAIFGMFRGFNPQKYVNAILDQTFKGKVEVAAEMTKGVDEAQLYAQYETGIQSFAKQSIAHGVSMEKELEDKYVALCKEIFADMKYSVKDDKKTKDGGYEVTVQYQKSDVMQRFVQAAASLTQELHEKVKEGDSEYRGLLEEINEQMNRDFVVQAYPLLEEAYKNMEYGKKETYVFHVTKGENDLYKMDAQEITEFLKKILDLDEKQD